MSRAEDDGRPTEAVAALFLDEDQKVDERVPAGTVIGGYVVERRIAEGGMGVVYAATHPVIGKRVAIKVLRRELSDDAHAIERFVLEARAVNAIGHPNIVDIFDLGATPDGRQFLVMDLLDGETLRHRIERGPVHVSVAAKLIDDCASALIATHETGIIHRDLKPDNVFVVEQTDRHPEARLLDFGIAKLVAAAHPRGSGFRTRMGAVLGTPGYMSPEQARAKDVDHRTDIYALGVMSFELLAGRRPYERASVLDLLVAHAEAPVPSLARGVPAIPIEVAQLVEAMLAKKPDDRPTLAAVRTVIKRLKSTVLPSLTDAHAAVAAAPVTPSPPAVTSSGPTRDEGPEQLANTSPYEVQTRAGRVLDGSFEMAIVQLAPGDSLAPNARMPSPLEVVPSSTAPGVAHTPAGPRGSERRAAELAPEPARSRLWIVFLVAAVAVAIGGVLLGMRL